eukprot:5684092-Amphidinium_carterae.1
MVQQRQLFCRWLLKCGCRALRIFTKMEELFNPETPQAPLAVVMDMAPVHTRADARNVFMEKFPWTLTPARELHARGQVFENETWSEEKNPDKAIAMLDEPDHKDANDRVMSTELADHQDQTRLRDAGVDWFEHLLWRLCQLTHLH